jgi:uncharacterized protein with PQ loop repeat
MDLELVGTILAVTAAIVVNAGIVPQIRLAARDRAGAVGVSMVSGGMICVTCLGWGVYAFERDLYVSLVSCVCGFAMWGTILVLIGTRERLRELAWPTAVLAGLAVAWFLAGMTGVGIVLLLAGVATSVPQLWRSVRRREAGVSATTWATAAAGASCWAVYGLAQADAILAGSMILRAVLAGAIVVVVAGQNARRVPAHTDHPVHATL